MKLTPLAEIVEVEKRRTITYRTMRISDRKIGTVPTEMINEAQREINGEIAFSNRGLWYESIIIKCMSKEAVKKDPHANCKDR